MSFLRRVLEGRPDGIRATVRRVVGGAGPARPGVAPVAVPPPEPAERALALGKEPPRDVTPPEGFEVVLHREALAPGRIIEVIVGGRAVAIANVDGAFHAISNACSHAEGPLGEGTLEGCLVTCPYHAWTFDVRDGSCVNAPWKPVRSYAVKVVGDAVCVEL